jgi:hypothetical protein
MLELVVYWYFEITDHPVDSSSHFALHALFLKISCALSEWCLVFEV